MDLVQQFKSDLDALLGHGLAAVKDRVRHLLVVPQHVEALLARERDQVTRLVPVDLARAHVDPSDEAALGPVVEHEHVLVAHAEKRPAKDRLDEHRRAERVRLLELLEDLHRVERLAHGVLGRIHPPHEVERLPKGLFAPRERGVDDVLAVAAHDGELPLPVVLQRLRVDLAHVELLGRERQPLAVGHVLRDRLEVRLLDLVVLGPRDLARRVHG
mmetsp:Transcript_9053/g.28472  ORF Transcript_9053/g.28472 Transcript_9053/m.28472 type:complete len:215 (-) Transcript_9053:968-1612(-)